MPAAAAMHGAYISQYPAVPSSSVSAEVGAFSVRFVLFCSEARTHQGQISELCTPLSVLPTAGILTGGCEESRRRLHWCLASLLCSI
jgi:hypothetical protein